MVRSFLLLGLLATGAASAQTVTLAFNFQDADTYRFNAAACPATITASWTSTFTVGVCSELKLWSTELECGDVPGLLDPRFVGVPQSDVNNVRTGTFTIPILDLPGFKPSTDGGVICGAEGLEKQHKLCSAVGIYNGTSGVCVQQAGTSLTMLYDTKPPSAPTIDEVSEQDGALVLKFTASPDTAVVHIDARPQGTTTFSEKGKVGGTTATSIRIENLVNGTTYELQARAEDGASNFSAPSELAAGTPRLTRGFWSTYRDAGGAEQGGCSAVHGLPLLLAGGLWLLRRKRN